MKITAAEPLRHSSESAQKRTGSAAVPELICPQCQSPFTAEKGGQAFQYDDYDVLTCRCSSYPVIFGIPILRKGPVGVAGQTVEEIIAAVRASQFEDALSAMVLPPAPSSELLAPAWMGALPGPVSRILSRRHARKWGFQAWSAAAKARLRSLLTEGSACDFLDWYLRRLRPDRKDQSSFYDYMAYRFGMPRHLVALSLASLIERPAGPILELGCGCGHITRALVAQANGQAVMAIDQAFWALVIAKRWMAPEAYYICGEADRSLPFEPGTFSAVSSTDAFSYFQDKAATIREVRQALRSDGIVILTSLNNGLLRHTRTGYPLRPDNYRALFNTFSTRVLADRDVLNSYLQKRGPDLSLDRTESTLTDELRISLVAAPRTAAFPAPAGFGDWPHARGELHINPLFHELARRGSKRQWQRQFPSEWYELDNADCKAYLPEHFELSTEAMQELDVAQRSSVIDSLLACCAILGTPKDFLLSAELEGVEIGSGS